LEPKETIDAPADVIFWPNVEADAATLENASEALSVPTMLILTVEASAHLPLVRLDARASSALRWFSARLRSFAACSS
jgi:hypothetical protein